MAKFLVHRHSIEEVEVEADNEEDALEAAFQAERDDITEVDYSWSVVAGPYELDEDDAPAADEG